MYYAYLRVLKRRLTHKRKQAEALKSIAKMYREDGKEISADMFETHRQWYLHEIKEDEMLMSRLII